MGQALISEREAAVGIEEFTRYAKSLGINFFLDKAQGCDKGGRRVVQDIPIELSFQATDEEFLKYMTSIDELKKAICDVEKFRYNP